MVSLIGGCWTLGAFLIAILRPEAWILPAFLTFVSPFVVWWLWPILFWSERPRLGRRLSTRPTYRRDKPADPHSYRQVYWPHTYDSSSSDSWSGDSSSSCSDSSDYGGGGDSGECGGGGSD